MSSSIVSSMSFLLLLVILLHMDEAFGAQTEIRKLKETMKMRRILEGNDYKSSKMGVPASVSRPCGGAEKLKNTATTYHPNDEFHPSPSGSLSFYCRQCDPGNICYTYLCTTTRICESYNGSPQTCRVSRQCVRCGN